MVRATQVFLVRSRMLYPPWYRRSSKSSRSACARRHDPQVGRRSSHPTSFGDRRPWWPPSEASPPDSTKLSSSTELSIDVGTVGAIGDSFSRRSVGEGYRAPVPTKPADAAMSPHGCSRQPCLSRAVAYSRRGLPGAPRVGATGKEEGARGTSRGCKLLRRGMRESGSTSGIAILGKSSHSMIGSAQTLYRSDEFASR